jgi:membrane associated rhomboid family serine protease
MWQTRYRSNADTPAVYALLIVFVGAFIAGFAGLAQQLLIWLSWPVAPEWLSSFQLWRPFTFPFVHGDFMSLIVDGMVLFFFGGSLERAWGAQRFLLFFFLSGIFAGAVVLALSFAGAGALFAGMAGSFVAVVVAFASLSPLATVYLFIFPVQARWLAVFVVAYDLFADYGRYGGRLPAAAAIAAVSLFAWAFATRPLGARALARQSTPWSERIARWRQRRRMRQWQRRVTRIERPDDLFKK